VARPRPDSEPPRTPDEVRRWAHQRREGEREPLPHVGERVLFRPGDWEPAVPAVVVAVQDLTPPQASDAYGPGGDANVWLPHPETGQLVVRPDPWPRVTLRTDDGREFLCREARVRGAPGWLRPGSRFDTT
jgi:hypothetical protein